MRKDTVFVEDVGVLLNGNGRGVDFTRDSGRGCVCTKDIE